MWVHNGAPLIVYVCMGEPQVFSTCARVCVCVCNIKQRPVAVVLYVTRVYLS